MPRHRYVRLMLVSATAGFGLVWAWTLLMPMAYLEPEYAAWQAKLSMVDRCDLGETLILGDSRAAADILPGRLDEPATNLALGGGEAIEALALLQRALRCPHLPRRVILSFDSGHFSRADLFWERSVRYGALTEDDIAALRRISAETRDASVYEERHTDIIPSRIRDWMWLAHFPTYDFASLLHAGFALRLPHNRAMLRATLAQRGHYTFGTAPASHEVAIEGHLASFHPLPVLDRYFDAILALLDQHGIEALFLPMPVNDTTARQVAPALRQGFTAWLHAYAERYRHFHVAEDVIPHRPDDQFGDAFCHMNPPAAERFSDELAQRLAAMPTDVQTGARVGWFDTAGPDASTREASAAGIPGARRGS